MDWLQKTISCLTYVSPVLIWSPHYSLSNNQLPAVLYLLEEWPSYVPYEKMLHRYGVDLTDQQLEDLERVKASGYAGETEEEKARDQQARERIAPLMNLSLRAATSAYMSLELRSPPSWIVGHCS